MYVEFNIEERSRNHFCRGNATSITHSECVLVALVVQHSMLMCPITLPPVAFLAVPHFSALSHKQQDFRGGGSYKTKNVFKKCKNKKHQPQHFY
jgi:hypothetical protein